MERAVVHLHVPDFCAVLEELRDPLRARRPLAVADLGARAVVLAVNALARREGIREGVPWAAAVRRCRALQVVPPDRSFYRHVHEAVIHDLMAFSPVVEGGALGRYFVDLSGTRRLWGPATDTACRLEEAVLRGRRLPSRAGLATNKLVSQVAAECVDVGDVSRVFPGGERTFLQGLPVEVLPGLGPKTTDRLTDVNIRHVGQLAALGPEVLFPILGHQASRLVRLARGEDPLPVVPFEKDVALRLVHALERDTVDWHEIDAVLLQLAEEAGWTLRRRNRIPRRVLLEVRYADGVEVQGTQEMKPQAQVLDRVLFQTVRALARWVCQRRVALRRIAVTWSRFQLPLQQLVLFPETQGSEVREQSLQTALDTVRNRYGPQALVWGTAHSVHKRSP
ncbi:DNA polymerase Y family protein [Desulfosoma sp.]|uniref:DNA polymerase Y family protein n=1 Tax=Desulfosoma sp. TaxID=2603217 RepID=UPI004049103D